VETDYKCHNSHNLEEVRRFVSGIDYLEVHLLLQLLLQLHLYLLLQLLLQLHLLLRLLLILHYMLVPSWHLIWTVILLLSLMIHLTLFHGGIITKEHVQSYLF
jgi:hypothetical protein